MHLELNIKFLIIGEDLIINFNLLNVNSIRIKIVIKFNS